MYTGIEKEVRAVKAVGSGVVAAAVLVAVIGGLMFFFSFGYADELFADTRTRIFLGAVALFSFVLGFTVDLSDQREQARLSREGERKEVLSETPILGFHFVGLDEGDWAECVIIPEGEEAIQVSLYDLRFRAGTHAELKKVRKISYNTEGDRFSEKEIYEITAPRDWFQNGQIPTTDVLRS